MGIVEEKELEELKRMDDPKNAQIAQMIFAQVALDDVMIPITLPPFKKPVTLPMILNASYAGGRPSRRKHTSSSSSREGYLVTPSSNPAKVDWSKVFSKHGDLFLDQILPQLPPVRSMTKRELGLYKQSLRCAAKGLAHYNAENQGAEYELVAPLLSNGFDDGSLRFYVHSNFLARSKEPSLSGSSPVELFFVECAICGCHDDTKEPLRRCCVLTPSSVLTSRSPPLEPRIPPAKEIFHPADDFCSAC